MNDTLVLFEDEGYRTFLPLSFTRPVCDIRCGIYTLRERLTALFGVEPAVICRPHLATVCGAGRWPLGLLRESAPLLLVNGRALDVDWLERLRDEPVNTVYVTDGGPHTLGGTVLLGARIMPSLASAVFLHLLNQQSAAVLDELRRFARVVEVEARLLQFPWELISANGQQIARDVSLLTANAHWPTADDLPLKEWQVLAHAPERIYIHPEARFDGPAVLDARDGPIVIGPARIEPFSVIQGPAAIGAGALIASARIRPETTIGPVCRIGGEVEASIVQGYSNKHHDGFLGHSYLGEWVNIGAMTTNSDLKNTYGTIKMAIDGLGQVDSGEMKLGCFLADHVKLGIGLHLNGGAVIGTGSNIFGVHFAPKTIPPFTWGGELFREYQIDRMVGVARKVMSRRKVTLSDQQETLFREVFAMTRGSRYAMTVDAGEAPSAAADAGLALAEQAAVEA